MTSLSRFVLPKGAAGPGARPTRATWCHATKVQGFDRGEAPRLICRTPGRRGRRGASRRKIKPLAGGEAPRWHHCRPVQPRRRGAPRRKITALIGVRHHVGAAECLVGPGDVVPRNEGSRLWPGGGTTSKPPNARPARAMWCPATKNQGFGEGVAPRRRRRLPGRAGRRGAPRRRIKALARVKHHVGDADCPAEPGDVVPRDEGSRL